MPLTPYDISEAILDNRLNFLERNVEQNPSFRASWPAMKMLAGLAHVTLCLECDGSWCHRHLKVFSCLVTYDPTLDIYGEIELRLINPADPKGHDHV